MDREALRFVYLLAFDLFAVDTSEVAAEIDADNASALKLLHRLEEANLVSAYDINDEAQGASRRGQYKDLTWQCNETYDSITREEAEQRFDAALPA